MPGKARRMTAEVCTQVKRGKALRDWLMKALEHVPMRLRWRSNALARGSLMGEPRDKVRGFRKWRS
jgi:hypothetical protein